MSKVLRKERCPECAKSGKDSSQDNLAVFDDGGAYCFACNYSIKRNGEHMNTTYTLPPSLAMPDTGIKTRGISKAVLDKYGVVRLADMNKGEPVLVHKTDGSFEYKPSNTIAFPYYDVSTKKLVAAKLRTGLERNFWYDGETSKMSFFGTNVSPSSARTLVIVEGETDTLTVAQAVPDVAVWGLPGNVVDKCFKPALHVIKQFSKVVVLFDNDEVGERLRAEAMALLPVGKAYDARYPAGHKDANELLCAGKEAELRRIIRDAKQITPKGVVEKNDFIRRAKDAIYTKTEGIGVSTGFPSLDLAIGGFSPGKVLTIVSGTGAGKSTVTECLALNAARNGAKTFFIPLEMLDTQVGIRMAQQYLRKDFYTNPYFDINSLPEAKVDEALEFVGENIHFFDHFGAVDIEKLIDTCETVIDSQDVKVIVLDHITGAASGDEGLDWNKLDLACSKMKSLALRKKVCVVIVSHISRDKGNEEDVPKLEHIRGGNGVAQWSDAVLGMGRKRSENRVKCRTIKVDRMVGKFVEFTLEFQDCTLVEVENSYDSGVDDDDDNSTNTRNNDKLQTQQRQAVPQQMGRRDSSDKPRDDVRVSDDTLGEQAHLQLRLAIEERDNGGVQGTVCESRPNQDVDNTSPTPVVRHQVTVPKWQPAA